MDDLLLEMKGIEKNFFAIKAVKNVDLQLMRGEVLALVGENGAGKSTLMKILSGSYPSHSYKGEIIVEGNPVQFHTTSDSEHAGIEMIYQEISVHLDLSIAENIFLGRLPIKKNGFVDWKKINRDSAVILQQVGLVVDPSMNARNLSTSQQQLMCIGKALMRNPKLLVLDEPTSALTETETVNLLTIIKSLREKGISSIYITHKLEEVFEIADKVLILRDGERISQYSRQNFEPPRIIEDMVGREMSSMYPKKSVDIGEEVLRVENFKVPSAVSRNKYIIEDVSFSVRSGEILGIGGLVGAGRSELVNALFGSHPRESGDIFLNGEKIRITKPGEAIDYGIGLVTEDRRTNGFVGTMTIRENITLASLDKIYTPFFINKEAERKHSLHFMDKLRIKASNMNMNVRKLSGGNQQKVVLAKWLMSDVKVLILDEPTRGIDVGAKYEIYTIMEELASQGVAIIMISSELPELLAMCDNFVILYDGKIQKNLTKEEVTEEKYIAAATGVAE
jgi:ABC-type sugar transport system ATPase subunit